MVQDWNRFWNWSHSHDDSNSSSDSSKRRNHNNTNIDSASFGIHTLSMNPKTGVIFAIYNVDTYSAFLLPQLQALTYDPEWFLFRTLPGSIQDLLALSNCPLFFYSAQTTPGSARASPTTERCPQTCRNRATARVSSNVNYSICNWPH